MITTVLERKRNKLELGSVFVTLKASRVLNEAGQSPDEFLARHESGDWGEVGSMDAKENELSFIKGYRVFSIYKLSTGEEIWIITQPDRSATTVILPEEY
jgi:cobalamin biosynthesis Mg chelatase CobN